MAVDDIISLVVSFFFFFFACLGIYYWLEALKIRRRVLHKKRKKGQLLETASFSSTRRNMDKRLLYTPLLSSYLCRRYPSGIHRPEDFSFFFAEYWSLEDEIMRAVEQLSSNNEEEVLAGCQTLQAVGNKSCLPLLEEGRHKWTDNQRVGRYLSAAESWVVARSHDSGAISSPPMEQTA